jgi:hypothetical protein
VIRYLSYRTWVFPALRTEPLPDAPGPVGSVIAASAPL